MKKGTKVFVVISTFLVVVALVWLNYFGESMLTGSSLQEQGTDTAGKNGGEVQLKDDTNDFSHHVLSELSYVVDPVEDYYAYSQLTEQEQKVYEEIYTSLLSFDESTKLSTEDKKQLDRIFNCVMMDHPEIFYVDGYQYTEYALGKDASELRFDGNYVYSKREVKDRMKQIDKIVDDLVQDAPVTVDEYELVKYAYDTIIHCTDYDLQAVDNQNICSVFLYGKSVCQGYAKAFQFLLAKLGVTSATVCGEVKGGERHAFSLVKMNGKWYYVDVTWGDACFLFSQEEEENSNLINYDYLGVTTEQLLLTHILDTPVKMPECTATKDNYYVREHAYFYSYNKKALQDLIDRAYREGKETVTIKCDSDVVFEEMRAHLIVQKDIFELLNRSTGAITYTHNQKQRSITFWL